LNLGETGASKRTVDGGEILHQLKTMIYPIVIPLIIYSVLVPNSCQLVQDVATIRSITLVKLSFPWKICLLIVAPWFSFMC
jgi:hypothetical protein